MIALLLAACSSSSSNFGSENSVACVWTGTGESGFNGEGFDLLKSRLYSPVDITFSPNGTHWVLVWNNHWCER